MKRLFPGIQFVSALSLLAVLFFCNPFILSAQETGPMETLKPILTDLTNILLDKNLQGEANKIERRKKIMVEVHKGFDFTEMSKRVLGRTWRTLSEKERLHFTELMTTLLENVYIGKFEEYEDQADKYGIKYIGEMVKGSRAQVTTEVAAGENGAVFPVHYIMQLKNGKWMVYDINLEGVSLIRNYQEQFKSILRTEKYEGLVKTLEKKIASFQEK